MPRTTSKTGISVLAAVGVLAAAGIYSWGPQSGPVVLSGWTAVPEAVSYQGQVEAWTAQGDTVLFAFSTPDTVVGLPFVPGQTMRVRTRSVARDGTLGGWSEWTNEWTAPENLDMPELRPTDGT